jgi:uncharacterized protein
VNVLITGAAGGLGRALAVECAKRGYNLFLTDINAAGLLSICDGLLCRYPVRIAALPCDITDSGQLTDLIQQAQDSAFRFDMLLNVAGVDYEGGFMSQDAAAIAQIVSLNIGATLAVTHRVLETRDPALPFYIVFVSSLASMFPMPLKATYAASKRFLLDFSCALREEVKQSNISVLTLCPGGLATTEEAMCGISAQGFMGSATANCLEEISRKTIDKALQGKSLYIPGLLNRVLNTLSKAVPRGLLVRMIYLRWQAAQKKWLTQQTTS